MPTLLRIFVSSPGDVIPERRRAHLVIEKLAKEYARFFTIQAVLWEVEPMLASGHFQDQIVPPSETDILLLVVWSRLGTALPALTETREYRGIDGRTPVTGTEWEFEDALAAQKRRGAPDVLAYRKQADPVVSLRDRTAKASAEEQWDKLDLFWNRWFMNKGQFIAAFSEFDELDGFEAKLENDLRSLIDRRIQAMTGSGQDAVAPTWLAGSPFRGLEFYRKEHAPIFFGRSATTKTSVEQLTQTSEAGRAFLLILGASGAGKSSLAQAGVLPSLTARGIVPRVGHWRPAVVRPGAHPDGPIAALAEALTGKTALPELLAGSQSSAAFARHLQAAADDPSFPVVSALNQIEAAMRKQGDLLQIERAHLVIVVDQLEELFTVRDTTASDRATFVRCIDGLARSGSVFVIATMRSDYWHRAAETPLLVDMAAGLGRVDLLPPARDEIIEMIRQPARAAGLDFEADPVRDVKLDAALATEAEASPGAMPLLSFLLDEIYKRDVGERHLSTLTYESMRQLGGLRGAIANRAEATFLALPIEVQQTLPRVLRNLVTVTRSGAAATSRDAPMSRFAEGSAENQLIQALLDPQVRLLVVEGDGDGARVRLAHEALITNWERAARQIEKDRDDLRTRTAIEDALAEWRTAAKGSKRDYLLRDPLLANAIDLAQRWHEEFDANTLAFIQASRRRARILFQLTVAAAAVFAMVAVFAAVESYRGHQAKLLAEAEKARAESQEAKALTTQSRFLTNQSRRLAEAGFNSTAMALSLEALPDPRRGNNRPYVLEAERGLFNAIQSPHERVILRDHTWTITNIAFSPDGKSLLSSSWDHTVRVWDTATWKPKLVLDDKAGAITVASFSPDGRFILAAPNDGTARIFDATTGAVVHRLDAPNDELSSGIYSPDGKRILTAASNKSPRLWNAETGTLIVVLPGNEDRVGFGAFASDSSQVVTVSADNVVHAYSAVDGRPIYAMPAQQAEIYDIGFSPDNRYLVTACEDGLLRVWDAKTGKPIRTMAGPPGPVTRIAFSHDGTRIAASYADKIARIWLVASGQQLAELTGHEGVIWSIVFSPDDKLVASTSIDNTARLWNAENGKPTAVFRGQENLVRKAAFSPDGEWLVTASCEKPNRFAREDDNTIRIWSTKPELEVGAIGERNRMLGPAVLSPDGRFAVVNDADSLDSNGFSISAHLWDLDTREELLDLPVDSSHPSAIASSDGARVATIDRDRTVSLWNTADGRKITNVKSQFLQAAALAFSRDGAWLAIAQRSNDRSSGKQEIQIINAADASPVKLLQGEVPDSSDVVAISSDGKWLLGLSGSDVRIWSLTDDRPPTVIAVSGTDSRAAFVDGAPAIVTVDGNGVTASWEIETGKQIANWPAVGIFNKPVISPNGLSIVTAYSDDSNNASMLRVVYRGSENRVAAAVDEGECGSSFVFSDDGQRFLNYGSNELVCLRDAHDGRLIAKVSGKFGPVSSAVCSPQQCDLAAIGTKDGTIFVWDIKSSEAPRTLKGHRAEVTDLAFLEDGKRLVTASMDGSARVWDVSTGKAAAAMQHEHGLASVSPLARSHRILTLSNKKPTSKPGSAMIVDLESGQVASRLALTAKSDDGILPPSESFEFSDAGDRLLFKSTAGNSVLFELPSGKVVSTDTDQSSAASLSPGGQLASLSMTPGNDGEPNVRLNIADKSGNVVKSIPVPGDFSEAGFSPDGKLLLLGNHLFSTETGEPWDLSGAGDDARHVFSPNGRWLARVSRTSAPDDPSQNAATVWNPLNGKAGAILQNKPAVPGPQKDSLDAILKDRKSVTALAISPDGRTAVVAFDDGAIEFWDPNAGRQLGTVDHLGEDGKADSISHTRIRSMAFAPDGKRIALIAGNDFDRRPAVIHLLNVSDRTELGSAPAPVETSTIKFSPDGRWIAASGASTSSTTESNIFQAWDANTLKPLPKLEWNAKDSSVSAFAFSRDGRMLARGSTGDQVVVFGTEAGNTIATLRGHGSTVSGIAFSPDGKEIATVAGDDKIHLWDAATFAETVVATGHGDGIGDIAYSPDGRVLVVASRSGDIGIWDARRRVQLHKLSGHSSAVKKLWLIAQGAVLVSSSEDNTIRAWKIDTGEEVSRMTFPGRVAAVDAAGTAVISAAARVFEEKYQLSVWDTGDHRKLAIQNAQDGEFFPVFSPDGKYLLLEPRLSGNDTAELWDVAQEKMIGKLEREDGAGSSAAFSPDSTLIVTYGSKDEAQIWRAADAHLIGTIVGSREPVYYSNRTMRRADFVFGGNRILTYSTNGLLRLSDTASLQLLDSVELPDGGYQIGMNGKRLIFRKPDGTVGIWRLTGDPQELVDLACERLPASLTASERSTYALDPEPEHYPCDRKPSAEPVSLTAQAQSEPQPDAK